MASADSRSCPGLELAQRASCLSDLLFTVNAEWLDKAMLLNRMPDGGWHAWSRIHVQQSVLRLAAWLESRGVKPGDRIGILGHNCPEWLVADFAILRLGAVTVPAYFTDPAEAVRYIFDDADCRLVIVQEGEQMDKLAGYDRPCLPFHGGGESLASVIADEAWESALTAPCPKRTDLATLIYTSGTTGHPKGVMLSHDNLLSDVAACLGVMSIWPADHFLSFLPVSHAFERTVGHFLPVACGSEIAYAEDVKTLTRDMAEARPTMMISVPRLYEKIHAGVQAKLAEGSFIQRWLFNLTQRLGRERHELKRQGGTLKGAKAKAWGLLDELVNAQLRASLGGRLRGFVSGGAALHPEVARFLLAADITVLPGYGLTEASPVLTVNRPGDIRPGTIGTALPGVELKLAGDGELLAKGAMVMHGYWHLPAETGQALDSEGWLHTGDLATIDREGFVRIVGRKKEIIVLSNGEKVPPAVVEEHLMQDSTILQAMVVGEDRPYIGALIVPDVEGMHSAWRREKRQQLPDAWRDDVEVQAWMLARMRIDESDLASFMQVRRFVFVEPEWTQHDGLLTPTLKPKRNAIAERFAAEIASLFVGDGDG